jgi:hypothetical protein
MMKILYTFFSRGVKTDGNLYTFSKGWKLMKILYTFPKHLDFENTLNLATTFLIIFFFLLIEGFTEMG